MSNYDNIPASLAAILNGNFNQEPVVVADPNEPTDEQRKLSDELVDMLSDLYTAEGDELAALNAVYDEKKAQILAINPNVHAGIADPDGYEFYHNIHKSEYGFRPRGHITCEAMRADIERIKRTAENIRIETAD